jgi:hypothetical protein
VSFDTVKALEGIFKFKKSNPDADNNLQRYNQMSGWHDVIDFLRAVAEAQAAGKFDKPKTGLENVSILDRLQLSGNPVITTLMKEMGG